MIKKRIRWGKKKTKKKKFCIHQPCLVQDDIRIKGHPRTLKPTQSDFLKIENNRRRMALVAIQSQLHSSLKGEVRDGFRGDKNKGNTY